MLNKNELECQEDVTSIESFEKIEIKKIIELSLLITILVTPFIIIKATIYS